MSEGSDELERVIRFYERQYGLTHQQAIKAIRADLREKGVIEIPAGKEE